MAGNFVHNDTNPQATIGREDRPWYAFYADDVHASYYHGDIAATTGINDDIQDALDLKAPLASPALTGTPRSTTPSAGDNSTRIATTEYVQTVYSGCSGARGLFSGLLSSSVPTRSSTGFSTWVNQGTATAEEMSAGLYIEDMVANGSGTVDYAMLVKTSPSTPYTITGLFSFLTKPMTDYAQFAFGWRNSSDGKMQGISWNTQSAAPYWYMGVSRWSSYSAWVSVDNNQGGFWWPYVWLQLKDDGTTVYFRFGADGVKFRTIYSVAKSSGYLGSSGYSQLFFGVNAQGAPVQATMMSYAQS